MVNLLANFELVSLFYGKKGGLVSTKVYICTHKINRNALYNTDNSVNSCYLPWFIRHKSLFTKGGKFPNGHVSGNKALRERGISCAQSQDREAQKKRRFSIDEIEKALNDSMN